MDDLSGILAQFRVGPTEQEKLEAQRMALMHAGLGVLSANQPGPVPRSMLGVLAQGAGGGLGAYQSHLKYLQDERKAGGAAALQVMQIKKALEQQDALKTFAANQGGAPAQAAGPTPAGMSAGTSQALFGSPDFMTKDIPPAAPAMQVPNFQGLLAAGVEPARVQAMMEDWKLRNPKGENIPGVGLVNPYSGALTASFPRITDTGRAAGLVPDGQGGFRVQVPQGAVAAYSGFQTADEQAKAAHDLVTVPATSAGAAPTFASRLSLLPGGGPATPGAPPIAGPRPAAGMSPAATSAQAADAAQQIDVAKNYASIYNNLQNASMQNPGKMAKVQRIANLLGDFEGGKLSRNAMDLASVANSAGFKIDPLLPNKQAAEALSGEIALDLRSTAGGGGMPGAMSDADREFLKGMTPQLGMTAEGRKTIVESKIKVMERENHVAKMARQYKQKYGTLNEDFFNQLSTWSERNPIFAK